MNSGCTLRGILGPLSLLALLSMTWQGCLIAQNSRGTLTGTVTDTAHYVLPGARLELQPTGQPAVSDERGLFTISNLAPGDYTLKISYVGLAPFSTPVKITAGQASHVDAVLRVGSASQEITVTADRPHGEAAAINTERTADNILQVLPAEVITSLPNTNVADALGRLPSVSLERDEGEGKYVQIRGTEPRLTNVTVNGVNLPSPESNVRNIKLDVIPADLVESLEVSKTLSANQDGDAIGGSVNLVTKSAGDVPSFNLNGLGGFTPIIGGRAMTQEGATWGRRFGEKKRLGILFGGSYDYNGRGINDVEPGVGTAVPANGSLPVPVYGSVDLRDYKYSRQRYGFAGGVDYRLGAGSSLYVKGIYSNFHDFGERWIYTPNAGNYLTPNQTDATGNETFSDSPRRPIQYVSSTTVGAHHTFGATLLDYEFSASRSGVTDSNFPITSFQGPQNLAYNLDTTNPYRPKLLVRNGVNVYDPSQYQLTSTEITHDQTDQTNLAGAASLTRNYTFGSHFGAFQAGLKIRDEHKTNSLNDLYYKETGNPILLSSVLGSFTDSNYFDNSYKIGPVSDYGKIMSAFNSNRQAFTLNLNQTRQRTDPNNFDITERVYAEYLMNTLDLGKFRLQTGLRIETTDLSSLGNHVTLDSAGNYLSTSPVNGANKYTNLLPSVQLRYALDANSNIRASYGRGIARPNFYDLVPYVIQQDRANTVSVGNPSLVATRAENFDLLFERYLQPLGIIQFGGFFKSIDQPIFLAQTTLHSGAYSGFSQQQQVNGTHAHIGGFEASWQQRLSFLPSFGNGFGITANYSYTSSQAAVPGRLQRPALDRQGPNNWNIGVTYDKRRLSARLGLTHNDTYIYSYNYSDGADLGLTGPNGDQYLYAHTQFDAQASYRLSPQLQVVGSVLNINNEPFGFYQGRGIYPVQREYYHPTYELGFRFNPFGDQR